MAHPFHHALSSSRKFGGVASDYQAIHDWFDQTKSIFGNFRHRALRHHVEGVALAASLFGSVCCQYAEHWLGPMCTDAAVNSLVPFSAPPPRACKQPHCGVTSVLV
jgi:hypothetical protein